MLPFRLKGHSGPSGSPEGQRDNEPHKNLDIVAKIAACQAQHNFPRNLFWRPEETAWDGKRQRLKGGSGDGKSFGARLQVDADAAKDQTRSGETQADLASLVQGIRMLRKSPGLENAVITSQAFSMRGLIAQSGRRLRFGVECDPGNQRFQDETKAAKISHGRIVRAIHRSGFRIVAPEQPFDPALGIDGLEAWANEVRLVKPFDYRRLAPLLLLALLVFLLWPKEPLDFFGEEIDGNLIIIVDTSKSMDEFMPQLASEVNRVIEKMSSGLFAKPHFEVIVMGETPFFGGLTPLDTQAKNRIAEELPSFLHDNRGQSVTLPAFRLAARYVAEMKNPTSIVAITDAVTLEDYCKERKEIAALFEDTEVNVQVVRQLFEDEAGNVSQEVEDLSEFAAYLNDPEEYEKDNRQKCQNTN